MCNTAAVSVSPSQGRKNSFQFCNFSNTDMSGKAPFSLLAHPKYRHSLYLNLNLYRNKIDVPHCTIHFTTVVRISQLRYRFNILKGIFTNLIGKRFQDLILDSNMTKLKNLHIPLTFIGSFPFTPPLI